MNPLPEELGAYLRDLNFRYDKNDQNDNSVVSSSLAYGTPAVVWERSWSFPRRER
jgi:hypothetical protein